MTGFTVGRSGRSLIAVFHGNWTDEAVRERLLAFRQRGPAWAADLTKAAVCLGQLPWGALAVRFCQVVPGADWADTRGNCGNALAVAAVDAMRRQGAGPVRLVSTNTGQEVVVTPAAGAGGGPVEVAVRFERPAGALTRRLLPTGTPLDRLGVPGVGPVTVSLIDAGNPYVFVTGKQVGLDTESLWRAGDSVLPMLEAIRQAGARRLGIPQPSVFPKIAVITPAPDGDEAWLQGRMITVPSWHPAFALTGMVCMAAAAQVPGTLVHRAMAARMAAPGVLVLRHPSGCAAVAAGMAPGSLQLEWASLNQTVTMLGEWEA